MYRKILLLFLLFFSSCFSTNITVPDINENAKRLSDANNNPICINISARDKSLLGYQYVIPYIPVGKLYNEKDFKDTIQDVIYPTFAIKGFSPIFNSTECKEALNIDIKKVTLNAYDLLATRYIVAKVKYSVVYSKNGMSSAPARDVASYTSFKRFAFDSELQYALQKSIEQMADDIILTFFPF